MPLIKTQADITRIQALIGAPRYNQLRSVIAPFVTRAETVRSLLPPGLEPGERPVVTAIVTHFGRSNYTGTLDFATLLVDARHGEHLGTYAVAMYVSTEPALIYGRELFGEPKKLAEGALERRGSSVTGECRRHGATLLSIQAELESEVPVTTGQFVLFNYRYRLATDCRGTEEDPLLMKFTFDTAIRRAEIGRAKVHLGSTPNDPLAEIEILESLSATYIEYDMRCSYERLATVDGPAFLPFAISRLDDMSTYDNL